MVIEMFAGAENLKVDVNLEGFAVLKSSFNHDLKKVQEYSFSHERLKFEKKDRVREKNDKYHR